MSLSVGTREQLSTILRLTVAVDSVVLLDDQLALLYLNVAHTT